MVKGQRQRDGVGTPVDAPIFPGWEEVGLLKMLRESQNCAARGNGK